MKITLLASVLVVCLGLGYVLAASDGNDAKASKPRQRIQRTSEDQSPDDDQSKTQQQLETPASEETTLKPKLESRFKESSYSIYEPTSLQCYECMNCSKVDKSNTLTVECASYLEDFSSPTCVSYSKRYQGKQDIVFRGCSTQLGHCPLIRERTLSRPQTALVWCNECNGDLCNGSPTIKLAKLLTVLLIPIIFSLLM